MKCFRNLTLRRLFLVSLAAGLPVLGVMFGFRGHTRAAELVEWVRNIEASSALENVFFRSVMLPSGPVAVRRPPTETRPALTELMATQPSNPDLVALRAQEDEQQLDFAAAEADWKKYAQAASDPVAAEIALADFYHRRLRPLEELKAITVAAQAPSPSSERFIPPTGQRSWQLFVRSLRLIREQALPASLTSAQYTAWMARYPNEQQIYTQYFDSLLGERQFAEAEQLLASYQRILPNDVVYPLQARAQIEYRRGSADAALSLYDRSFQPLWPPELVKSYFELLQKTHHLRDFLARARVAVAANPDDLGAATRIFYYYQQQGNVAEGQRALTEFRLRRESRAAAGASEAHPPRTAWTTEELFTLAQLFESANNADEAARYYYALYSLPGTDAAAAEKALAGITRVLLAMPEQPIRFGSGDFSFYRDVATADPYPGFLNGILSLVLNTTSPSGSYASEEQASVSYFHRGRAAELVSLFDSRFPQSTHRAELHGKLIEAYAAYGADDGVIRAAREFLASFPSAPERTHVALMMADAFARKNDIQAEFSTYDALLKELAAQADGVPLGAVSRTRDEETDSRNSKLEVRSSRGQDSDSGIRAPGGLVGVPEPQSPNPEPRSPEYVHILDRYIARLVSLNRIPEVLQLYRREIDRNPNDPGLYERLAAFMSENYLGQQVEQVYRLAMQRFPDRSWYDKLARWYLRRRMMGQLDQLTREVVKTFSGTDLENYFREVIGRQALGPSLYLQLNRYAHERFPHNLTFVRNLLDTYASRQTADPVAWEQLLRSNWFHDDALRSQFFEYLTQTGRLDSELADCRLSIDRLPIAKAENRNSKIETRLYPEAGASFVSFEFRVSSFDHRPPAIENRKSTAEPNPGATQFIAEAEVWRSHFEQAAPPLSALSAEYPADASLGHRAADINRSLASLEGTGYRGQVTGNASLSPVTSKLSPFETGLAIEENLHRYTPRDHTVLTRIGETYADREMYDRALPYWEMLPQIEPGEADGYLEAATVLWDYYRFDDALRLIEDGRRRLGNPALYAYQAGAIYENKRDFAHAAQEYLKGALAANDTSARARLLQLARRKPLGNIVDQATGQAVAGTSPSLEAVSLRVAVLQAQQRRDDIEQLLTRLTESTQTVEREEFIAQIAEQQGFDAVRERSLKRQIALTTDPVDAMRLRLGLARDYEGRGDIESARSTVEALYHDKPTVLGVVRAGVDFYWRNKMPGRAVDLLQRAAAASYPDLKKRFTLEAARKSIDSGQFPHARELLTGLLREEPFNAEYSGAMADTYARANDDAAVRDFYLSTIRRMGEAPLPSDERVARIAAMHRALIPALTRLQDHAGSIDQYVEIINKYPEDAGLIEEAAAYAGRYQRQQQLVGYYTKASADSPRDFRWPMVLARLEAYFEDFPAAIAAYNRAIQIRPDRSDFYIARAAFEERLARFEEAAQSYTKIYELTYHDSQWMSRIAEVRARQGQNEAATEALARALVEGRPERPENLFEVARRLEMWNILPQARRYAERGLDLAANKLFVDPTVAAASQVYPRVMTRLHDQETACMRLLAVWKGTAAENAAKRVDPSLQQFELAYLQAALKEMGSTAERYFTPEEKFSFQAFLEGQKSRMPWDEFVVTLVPLAESAGLADLEARWRYELMMALHADRGTHMFRLIELQSGRMKFAELGRQLEAYAKVIPPEESSAILAQAARMYQSAEESNEELRVLSELVESTAAGVELRDRYFTLLRAHRPQELASIAERGRDPQTRNAAANFAVASEDEGLALSVLAARGRSELPIWNDAFTGLMGLYYEDPSTRVRTAFAEVLNADAPIGARLGKPTDPNQQLAGDTWFYYGSRYGEYLDVTRRGAAEDFLPAELEATPGSAPAYFTLADYYGERGDAARAIGSYDYTLELDPLRGDADDRVAAILWQQGKRDEATTRWKAALQAFTSQEDKDRLPEEFWENVRITLAHLGEHKLLPAVRDDADRLLRTYVHRNGWYRVNPLLQGAIAASDDPAAGVTWIIDLARSADNALGFLQSLVDATWVPEAQREAVFRRILELAERDVAQAHGEAVGYAQNVLDDWRLRWAEYLVKMKRPQPARQALSALSPDARKSRKEQVAVLEVEIAAKAKDLETLFTLYASDPDKMPSAASLLNAATELRKANDAASARRVLQFTYTNELERHNFTAANFLGLAEVRLEEGDVAGALALLRRLVLVVGQPFENLGPAADLLEKHGRPVEAAEFLSELVKASPWDAAARFRLAREQLAAKTNPAGAAVSLVTLVAEREAPYDARALAALELGRIKKIPSSTGRGELGVLASGSLDPTACERPFLYVARVEAAKRVTDPATRMRLLLGALDISPRVKAIHLSLMLAAARLGHYPLVVAAYEQLVSDRPAYEFRGRRYDYRRPPSAQEQEASNADDFRSELGVDIAEAAQTANILSEAYTKLDRLDSAERYLRIAFQLELSTTLRSELKRRLDAVKAERERRMLNSRRQPTVGSNLDQSNLVRPSLRGQVTGGR